MSISKLIKFVSNLNPEKDLDLNKLISEAKKVAVEPTEHLLKLAKKQAKELFKEEKWQ